MHLDVETLERAIHGEFEPGHRAAVERHLAACADCAARLGDARREEERILGLLEALDHEPPALDWSAVTRESRAGGPWRSLLAASLAFLVVAAGILYAIPGSSVRSFVASVLRDDPDPVAPPVVDGAVSGIAVVPGDPFEVAFAARQEAGRIRVILVSSDRLELRVLGDPVELESGLDRLAVSNAGSEAGYELRVPRSLGSLRVTVAGSTVFDKRGPGVRVPRSPDPSGAYLIDLQSAGT
jgi:anti-sigma factor RsiW